MKLSKARTADGSTQDVREVNFPVIRGHSALVFDLVLAIAVAISWFGAWLIPEPNTATMNLLFALRILTSLATLGAELSPRFAPRFATQLRYRPETWLARAFERIPKRARSQTGGLVLTELVWVLFFFVVQARVIAYAL